MSFFLTEIGIRSVKGLIKDIDDEISEGMGGRMKEAAELVADKARSLTHSRRVKKAISFTVRRRSAGNFEAVIGPEQGKAFFAHFLEFGTKHSRAFPYLAPAAKATEDKVVELVGIPPSLGGRGRSGFSFSKAG
jgi:HK97 gp10 family phage protein